MKNRELTHLRLFYPLSANRISNNPPNNYNYDIFTRTTTLKITSENTEDFDNLYKFGDDDDNNDINKWNKISFNVTSKYPVCQSFVSIRLCSIPKLNW